MCFDSFIPLSDKLQLGDTVVILKPISTLTQILRINFAWMWSRPQSAIKVNTDFSQFIVLKIVVTNLISELKLE